MTSGSFKTEDLFTVSSALEIAEDKTGDYYKFSIHQWRRHQYEIKTLKRLKKREIVPEAFALLDKCARVVDPFESKTKSRDFYFICLQDHHILKALNRDDKLKLLPLLVYVLTHELIHIVRFCDFSQRYHASGMDKEKEEQIVHNITYDILSKLALPRLDYILESYQGQRISSLQFS